MHWLARAAARAQLRGFESLSVQTDVPLAEAWELTSRTLGMTPRELAEKLAPAFGLGAANLELAEPRALALLPERLARKYSAFPLREDDRHLVVATADPTNLEVEHAIGFASGRRPVLELACPTDIEEALFAGYSADKAMETLLNSVDNNVADAVRIMEELAPEVVDQKEVETGPVVKLTSLILRDAVVQGASDIHIEPGPKGGAVRFRIDGVMRQHMHLPMPALNRIVSRLKVMGKLDIANRMAPQDGRAKINVDGRPVDLRLSTVPTRDAEKAVIRLLRPENAKRLEEIGVTPRELARFRQLMACRDGIVIVTGPTGSGKTTTLYSAIKEIATGDVNVMTVEDPVEYELGGITQIQVDPKRGVTFANSLRALLRQDPDVIFVGEIRDSETAQIAAQAAMTGHLVLATLHTNDAMSAVTRLVDLGLDRATIAATLRGIVAQRLIRKVCSDCAQPLIGSLTEEEERLSKNYGVMPLSRAVGCKRCANTGFRGRLPLAEVAIITPILADQIAAGATTLALTRSAVTNGMASLRDVAIARVRRGETTLGEVERVLGDALEDAEVTDGPPSILVINHDAAWRRMARATLEAGGFRVTEALDGAEALKMIQEGRQFSLMFTDVPLEGVLDAPTLGRVGALSPSTTSPIVPMMPDLLERQPVAAEQAQLPMPMSRPMADWSRFTANVQAGLRKDQH